MIQIVVADITTLDVDAIVNAANESLRGGGGVDGAIHAAAGPELYDALLRFPGCPTGDAVLTRGYRLPARFVIHAVGPVWRGGGHGEAAMLARTYENAFRVARESGEIRSVAFPAISTGVYHFPRPEAAKIALTAMLRHEPAFDRVVACLYDVGSGKLYEQTLAALRAARLGQ